MPKATSHSSQIRHTVLGDGTLSIKRLEPKSKELRQRRSLGVLMGADLLTWVADPRTRSQKRIDSILTLILQLRDLNRSNDRSEGVSVLWQGKRFSTNRHLYSKDAAVQKEEDGLRILLDDCLKRYRFTPTYYHQLDDRPILGWYSGIAKTPSSGERPSDATFSEGDAVLCIMELAREDLLRDLQRCECGKLFFGRFIHHKFCSQACQQQHYRSSADYKAAHREYMKNLRAMHKRSYFPTPAVKKKTAAKTSKKNLITNIASRKGS